MGYILKKSNKSPFAGLEKDDLIHVKKISATPEFVFPDVTDIFFTVYLIF